MDYAPIWVCLGITLLLPAGCAVAVIHDGQVNGPQRRAEHAKMISDCEGKGGVILDRTYTTSSGKTKSTGHNYSCVRKDAVLD